MGEPGPGPPQPQANDYQYNDDNSNDLQSFWHNVLLRLIYEIFHKNNKVYILEWQVVLYFINCGPEWYKDQFF